MTRADLLALAERAERAEGADRDIDAAIMRLFTNSVESDDGDWWYGPHDEPPRKVPAFTASLDAAASLVPDGWEWERYRSPSGMAMMVFRDGIGCHGHTATPALALTAAALRARAQEAGDE